MNQNQIAVTLILLAVVMIAVAILTWELAVGRYRSREKKREIALRSTQEKYAEILRKLDEDPQAYAMGIGISYVVKTMRATLDAIEADLEKPT